jgi:hypothetical protein
MRVLILGHVSVIRDWDLRETDQTEDSKETSASEVERLPTFSFKGFIKTEVCFC